MKRVNIGRIPVDFFTKETLNEKIKEIVESNAKKTVLNTNAHLVQLANHKQHWLIDYFKNEVDYIMCDGGGIALMSKINGLGTPEKIAYNTWFWEFANYCTQHNISLFFLGAKPGVAERAAQRFIEKNPGLRIDFHHGYFNQETDSEENKAIIQKINQSKANILLVGFGMPTQEKYIKDNFDKINVNVFMSCGGAFDFFSGDAKVAPKIINKLYLEWLYRLILNPKRLWKRYFYGNIRFIYYALKYRKDNKNK